MKPGERAGLSDRGRELFRTAERMRRESAAAEELMPRLSAAPCDRWETILHDSPGHRTAAVVDCLLDAAEARFDWRPADALVIIDLADRVAASLENELPPIRLTLLGDVWRARAGAWRQLFRLEESLAAALHAEDLYAQLRAPAFPVATAWQTRAATLFEMTRLAEALALNARATRILDEHGASLPLAQAWMLEAAIRLEQGDLVQARDLWRRAIRLLESLHDPRRKAPVEIARCHARLAECDRRRHDHDPCGPFRPPGVH